MLQDPVNFVDPEGEFAVFAFPSLVAWGVGALTAGYAYFNPPPAFNPMDWDDSFGGSDAYCAKGESFRGGKKKDRDNWGKYSKERDFQRCWHRKGKKEWGGKDMEPEQFDDVWNDWVSQGKPKVK